jgi:hypothetical protein
MTQATFDRGMDVRRSLAPWRGAHRTSDSVLARAIKPPVRPADQIDMTCHQHRCCRRPTGTLPDATPAGRSADADLHASQDAPQSSDTGPASAPAAPATNGSHLLGDFFKGESLE